MTVVERAIDMATEHMERCESAARQFEEPLEKTAYYEWEYILGILRDQKVCANCDFWCRGDPRCMSDKSQWAGRTVRADNYCGCFAPRARTNALRDQQDNNALNPYECGERTGKGGDNHAENHRLPDLR